MNKEGQKIHREVLFSFDIVTLEKIKGFQLSINIFIQVHL